MSQGNHKNIFFDPSKLAYLGKNVIIGKTVRIRHPELVSVGDNSIIDDFCYISGEVTVGKYVHVGASCSVQASGATIKLNDFSALASGVRAFATSADYINVKLDTVTVPEGIRGAAVGEPIVLEPFSWVGANSVILPGATLPIGCVVGALTKVTKHEVYEPWSIYDPETKRGFLRILDDEVLGIATALTGVEYEK